LSINNPRPARKPATRFEIYLGIAEKNRKEMQLIPQARKNNVRKERTAG